MLQVVQDDEHLLVHEELGEHLIDLSFSAFAQAQDVGNRREQQLRLPEGGQLDEDHAIPIRRRDPGRNLKRQPGLAGAAWTGDRYDPGPALTNYRHDLRDLGIPPDKRRELDRQTRPSPLTRRGYAAQRALMRKLRDAVSHASSWTVIRDS